MLLSFFYVRSSCALLLIVFASCLNFTYGQCPDIITSPFVFHGQVISLYYHSPYVLLSSQSAIDSFPIRYPNCTILQNTVIGQSNGLSDIASLDSLQQIEDFGDIVIVRTELQDLRGLNVNQSDVRILGNPLMTTLEHLESSDTIGKFLIIDNAILNSLGTQQFRVCEDMTFFGNHNLANLTGLENLQTAASLNLRSNYLFSSLTGLSSLTKLGDLYLESLDHLSSMEGLMALEYIDQSMVISYCSIDSLTGISSLNFIGRDLLLRSNSSLTNIAAIGDIETVQGNIEITNNSRLRLCNNTLTCNFLSSGYHLKVSGNGPGCATPEEVMQSCGITSPCPYNLSVNNQNQINGFSGTYPGCQRINGSVTISGEDITSLGGLSNLRSIGNELVIKDNINLNSLTGLDSLGLVREGLVVESNPSLQNLLGIEQIYGMRLLSIFDNDALPLCNIKSVCKFFNPLPENYSYPIEQNASGCAESEVRASCNCPTDLDISVVADGIFHASQIIELSGNLLLNSFGRYNAPTTILNSYTVPLGASLEINNIAFPY